MNDSIKIVAICITVCLITWMTMCNDYKKIHGRGFCNVINGMDDIKYLIKRKPFVVCEGECNVNYKATAYNIFQNYGDEFVVMYCGEDKDKLPSQLKGK